MAIQTTPDIDQSFYGDMIYDPIDYIKVTDTTRDALANIVINRVKAVLEDWEFMVTPANLDAYIGQQNTRETATLIEEDIERALYADPFAPIGIFDIRIIPLSFTSVGIFITSDSADINLAFGFSFTSGFESVSG